jgi:hypothetical protein
MRPRALIAAALLFLAACTSGAGGGRAAVEQLASEDDTTDAQTECILRRLETEFDLALDDLDGELSAEQRLTVAIARDVCLLDPDAASPTDGGSPAGDTLPAGLDSAAERFDPDSRPPGEDEALDALWIACGEGDGDACDNLLFDAAPGSDYEAFGFSCGGRENLRCTTLLGEEQVPEALTASTPPPGEDRVLDPWWEQCAAGSARACDQLLLTAPGGTDYYEFGNTCGGRAVAFCSQLLGDDGNPPILDELAPTDLPPGRDDLLDQLWAACGLRNPQACDDLYSVAQYGSIYERFAISCGGVAIAPCDTLFLEQDASEVEERQDAEERGS